MPPPRPVTDAAAAYAADQAALTAAAARTVGTANRALTGNPGQWQRAVVDAAEPLLALQLAAAQQADPYLDASLSAQGARTVADAVVNAAAFVDLTDGGGSWMRRLLYVPLAVYRSVTGGGGGAAAARSRAQFVALSIVMSAMQDVSRSAVMTSMATRPDAKTWVRALRGKSCARCAILAGRHYRVSAFRRHPRCDCYMIPSAEDFPDDWTTDPRAYFRRLSAAEQDAIFTGPGAAAIRAGADIAQIVNASRGIDTVTAFGRNLQVTTEGTSVRGLAGQRLAREQGTTRVDGLRRANALRLMPDEIFQLAEREGWDRAEVLRQLERFGYIV